MMTPNVGGPLLELHRTGKVRILAVTSAAQIKAAPDIPTAIEAGLPGMIAGNLNGLFAPAGVPRAIIDRSPTRPARSWPTRNSEDPGEVRVRANLNSGPERREN